MRPEAAMALALARARRASGRTFPNPAVGAVVLRGERVLGVGETQPPGSAHAEVRALRQAERRHGQRALVGATLAVTLEPCSHHGRTPPCTDAIRAAGIARVWIGVRDPHRLVDGRGIRALRRAGIAVETGVCEGECAYQHRGFASAQQRGRPWVALKLAATLDGRIATARGESRWLTSPEARAHAHRLRDAADAVMVGSGTARADDPALSVRRPGGSRLRTPIRVVVDAGLAAPPRLALFRDADAARTWLLTANGHSPRALAQRSERGARVLLAPRRGAHLDLPRALELLAREGLTQLLVEGGGGLAAALLRAGLVDELHWYCAPSLLGGDARAAVAALGVARLAERLAFELADVRRVGPDLYVHALTFRKA
jgi:diaminohydroxyphosphoribosylaminopyrimidine deaminase/5-amino-6-(5-phosphoribosylamino)uracil reductase